MIDITRFKATLMALASLSSLSSCLHHDDAGDDSGAQDEPLGEMISCATHNASVFNDDCRLERESGGLLVVHHPDGGFRRLRLGADGSITTADGFLKASSQPAQGGGGTEVKVGEDRYVIPPAPGSAGASADAPLEGDTPAGSQAGQ